MPTVGMELTSAQTYTDSEGQEYVIHRLLNDDNGDCILAFCNSGGETLPATADGSGAGNHEAIGFARGCILMDQHDGTPYKNTGTNLIANFVAA